MRGRRRATSRRVTVSRGSRMFGWFGPRCPLDLPQKAWTEFRMRWLADRLGPERLLKATVVTPTAEFLPDSYHPDGETIAGLYERLAGFMGVSSSPALRVRPEAEMSGASGVYVPGDAPEIHLNELTLADPAQLVATICHELAHDILLGGRLIDPATPDHEYVTDLLLIYLGVGIIPVNCTIKDRTWTDGSMAYFEIRRSGYLTAMDFGYALALFAYARGEEAPAWAAHLRADAAEVMRKGLRFLQKTGDSVFRPDNLRVKPRPPAPAEARDTLAAGTPTEQLVALWQLADAPLREPAIVEALAAKLADRTPALGEAAAHALRALGPFAAPAAPALLKALDAGHAPLRAAAAGALGATRALPEKVVPALVDLLGDANPAVVANVGHALAEYGAGPDACARPLLAAADAALYRNPNEPSVTVLAAALARVADDAEERVRAFYEEGNDEHRDFLLELLEHVRGEAAEGD
jgi:hypothetical protein